MSYDKIKKDFTSKRCEQILQIETKKDKEHKENLLSLIKRFKSCLDDSQIDMFLQCIDEINSRNSDEEEKIYSAAFGDGIFFAFSYLIKNKNIFKN